MRNEPGDIARNGRESVDESAIAHKIAAEQNLTLVQFCGGGGFGQVWLALDADGWRRAFKIVNIARGKEDVAREMRGVREHCNRVNDEESLLTIFHRGTTDGYFWYLMQLADDARADDGSYLADTLELRLHRHGCYTPTELHPIISQVLDGVKALHSHCLVHRDIKPANVLFIRGRAVLGDVGLVEDSTAVSLGGTEGFVPREIQARMTHSIDGEMQDLYAVGCLIRVMMGVFEERPALGYHLPTGRVARKLNALANRACSVRAADRYRDVDEFSKDFERCYGWTASLGAGSIWALTIGAMGLILGILAIALAAFWKTEQKQGDDKGRRQPGREAEVAMDTERSGTAINWYTVLSRTRLVRDYEFNAHVPEGLKVSMEPQQSAVGFMDEGNLRCRRLAGFLGKSRIRLSFDGPLPRSFELIWMCGGDFSGMTERITLKAGTTSGELLAHMRGGAFLADALPEEASALPKCGFMSVQRLICIDGRLRLLVDGLPVNAMEIKGQETDWESLELSYEILSGGEIYFSSFRLNEFLE